MTDSRLVVPLAEVGAGDLRAVGGKGANLGELMAAGISVPPGFVVTTAAFQQAMRGVDPGRSIAGALFGLDPDDRDGLVRAAAGMRDRITAAPLPAGLDQAVAAGCEALDDGTAAGGAGVPVAVRSSATGEDSADASYAGLQDTYLWIRGAGEVADRVRRCWASLYSVEAVTYRLRRRLPEEAMAMAVVVQRMVDARCAGVLFTRSPATGDRSVVAIEASWGLGSAVVSGEVTPDAWVVNKVTGETLRRTVASKLRRHRPDPAGSGVVDEPVPDRLRDEPSLSDADLQALVGVARRVERHFGRAQDVEWAISSAGELFVLQSRPETAWSAREAGPVAAPGRRPFDHVLRALGAGGTGGGTGGGDGGAPA